MTPTTVRVKDTLVVALSDMHSGSSVALIPDRFMQFKHGNHTPTPRQREMFEHFLKCADYARQARKGKRLVVVHVGDAIEGVHHSTRQVVTYIKDEQADIHAELMDTFLRRAKFARQDGDRLFYVTGTETHVEDKEDRIAMRLPAEKNAEEGGYSFDHLELMLNGRLLWFVHHGPRRGKGPNKGNAARNWLRDLYFDALEERVKVPDVVFTGHTHTPMYQNYVVQLPESPGYHVLHGIICPSWQRKTRFAYRAAPVDRNEVGAAYMEVRGSGELMPPAILRASQASAQVVRI